jgi:hypothetical protein
MHLLDQEGFKRGTRVQSQQRRGFYGMEKSHQDLSLCWEGQLLNTISPTRLWIRKESMLTCSVTNLLIMTEVRQRKKIKSSKKNIIAVMTPGTLELASGTRTWCRW